MSLHLALDQAAQRGEVEAIERAAADDVAISVEVGAELRRIEEEERFAVASLDRMNRALDRWARDTYGA